jgi:inner membrane transporter RhtA
MRALRRLPPVLVGLLLSAAPAVAAVAGWLVLGEALMASQWVAIGCIAAASAGSAATAHDKNEA